MAHGPGAPWQVGPPNAALDRTADVKKLFECGLLERTPAAYGTYTVAVVTGAGRAELAKHATPEGN